MRAIPACWLPTTFPIQVKTATSKVFDYSATQYEATLYACLAAAVWPLGENQWDDTGSFTIECGQLPFRVEGTLHWTNSPY